MKPRKIRLDALLLERGLAVDAKEAQALVLAGQVLSGDTLLDSVATLLAVDAELRVRGRKAFASRAGDKLNAALDASGISVQGLTCLDLGASTGGFTHCLLQRGAAKVVAVDKGHQQLAWALTQDPRVDSRERCDALSLTPQDLPSPIRFVSADISFDSLKPFLPLVSRLLQAGGHWIFLVKPQFEADPADVPKGGVVRDDLLRQQALDAIRDASQELGLGPQGSMASPIAGAKGNREWLLWGQKI